MGAKTTHGGTVISGSPHTTHNGIPVARKGDKVSCKKCKKIVTIATGDPSFIIDGSPIARAGDVTTCGSKLIAIQQSFAQSDFEVGSIDPPEEYMATYGDVDQGSDNEGYFTIDKVYLNNNTFVPLDAKPPGFRPLVGHAARVNPPKVYDKIFIKIKIKNGSFKDFNVDIEGVSHPLAFKAGKVKEGDIVTLEWDGFINKIYDSKLMLEGVNLRVYATDLSTNAISSQTKKVVFRYMDKDWLDIKIDKNLNKIYSKIRVSIGDLKWDGTGLVGRVPSKVTHGSGPYILEKDMYSYLDDNKVKDLVRLSVKRYWSRHHNTIKSKKLNVSINGRKYQFYTVCDIKSHNAMPKLSIKFNTNDTSSRSRNWCLSRIVYYNIGNINYNSGWTYVSKFKANRSFMKTFSHELGHEILLAAAGHDYSKTHKGSSSLITQSANGSYKYTGNEYDLMKYDDSSINPPDVFEKTVASEEDVCSLLWISRLTLKAY